MIEQIKVKSSIAKVAKIIPFAIKTNLKQSGNDCLIEFNNTDINKDTKETAKECLLRYLKFNNIKVVQRVKK